MGTIVAAILIFCLLIFVHELGHFIAAKACGVEVLEFSLGMGPRIIHFKKGETEYSLRALPIGGFCKMLGEDEDNPSPKSLNNKSALKRGVVFGAGAFMNLITAIVIMIGLTMATGFPNTTVDSLAPGFPASEAGLQKGDKIVKINDKKVTSWDQITESVSQSRKSSINLKVERDKKEITINCPLKKDSSGQYKMGISPAREKSVIKSIGKGFTGTWDLTKRMFKVLDQLITGQVSAKNLTGPVGIVVMVGASVKSGLSTIAFLTALISLNLAIFNLLPLPALDGGRILFLIINAVTKKEISPELEGKIHMIGLLLLFGLMIFVTIQDVGRFFL